MNRESDLDYFARRAREEREKAENAPDPPRYRKHLDFAHAYERRVLILRREEGAASASVDAEAR
jgi:hypothetical protein